MKLILKYKIIVERMFNSFSSAFVIMFYVFFKKNENMELGNKEFYLRSIWIYTNLGGNILVKLCCEISILMQKEMSAWKSGLVNIA